VIILGTVATVMLVIVIPLVVTTAPSNSSNGVNQLGEGAAVVANDKQPSNPPLVATSTNPPGQNPTLKPSAMSLPAKMSPAIQMSPAIHALSNYPSVSLNAIDIEPTLEVVSTSSIPSTVEPTNNPSLEPTVKITDDPSFPPTIEPTSNPSLPPTMEPTAEPTSPPSSDPTLLPSMRISERPSAASSALPTIVPSSSAPTSTTPTRNPTRAPTRAPTGAPTREPTREPTRAPIREPTIAPSTLLSTLSYQPGNFSLDHRSDDGFVRLSNGLAGKLIAVSGEFVSLAGNRRSSQEFHISPDGAAVFENPETGGWYYVSNAENKTKGTEWLNGGVGSIEFDASGQAIGYERVANRLRMNCGGGKTPWNSWVTCEEIDGGRVYQVDPKGVKEKNRTDMGSFGAYESFAYDIYTDPDTPRFFVTRDAHNGVITRFTPNEQGMECYRKSNDYDRWCTLNYGTRDYLLISGGPSGTFVWTTDLNAAKENAELYYKHTEGIDSYQGYLYFTSKKEYRLVILNLEDQTYTYESTKSGSFNAQPDQVARILNGNDDWEDDHDEENKILYFCEDGGRRQDGPGIFGRDAEGKYFTILYSDGIPYQSETTGLAYSPSGHDMYVSFQEAGRIYRFYRRDGHPFQGSMLDIKYHTT